ncbi:MAG: DUF4271 domain-containing protein [Winogradskyella sp.]|uniref:DUF4271 domain-containing protein n=1 Tax=Winogradskyella sp. TaxID=1883156 RepID=UPI0017A6CF44|nr:DUF4271 domain-containing protein [Winogradskyella sp.]MBT8243999.1 DUF4271 domain-containing protein [Winogradskyella sp.]NNK23804.1 DUF4271 domain-containing protein [Winogradskyella sp.]
MLREYFTQDLFTGLILVCLLLLVATRQLFTTRFNDFLSVTYNIKYLKLYARERKEFDFFNILLFANFIISAGIFSFLILKNLITQTFEVYSVLPSIVLVFIIILILKSFLERVVGYYFEFLDLVKIYLLHKNSFKYISGLILVLINILLLFSDLDKKLTIYVSLSLLFLINLSGFIRFLKPYQKEVIHNFFYFLLYLCALEIGPYVILYKVFKDYFG